MKIVLAIDSYKGCASSSQLSAWVEEAILSVDAQSDVVACCIADGGEGLLEATMRALGGQKITCPVPGPLMEPMEAQYGI